MTTNELLALIFREQKLMLAHDPDTELEVLDTLSHDPDEEIARAVWGNPGWVEGRIFPLAQDAYEEVSI